MQAVHADKPPTIIIERQPKLAATFYSLPLAQVRSKTEIGSQIDRVRRAGPPYPAAHKTARHVDPIVEAQGRMTHTQLGRVARVEPREKYFAHIRASVVVGVPEEK